MARRLEASRAGLSASFQERRGVPSFVLDDLLPETLALEVYRSFPETGTMLKRHSLRE